MRFRNLFAQLKLVCFPKYVSIKISFNPTLNAIANYENNFLFALSTRVSAHDINYDFRKDLRKYFFSIVVKRSDLNKSYPQIHNLGNNPKSSAKAT